MVRLVARLSQALRLLDAAPSARRAFAVQALCGVALTACMTGPIPIGARGPLNLGLAPPAAAPALAAGHKIAILLPLTGPNAGVGKAMLQAAQLALPPGSPDLVPQDTHGTPDGAASAARDALAAGAGIILGPLTAGETGAAGAVARAANVPMLAFTSDPAQAQPGVWPLGITPAQQVRPLVLAMRAEGKTRIAAVLPQNAFGDALATGLLTAAADAQLPPPPVVRAASSFAGFNGAMKTVSDYATRRSAIEAQQHAASPDAAPADPAAPAPQPVPPLPFDALFFGASGSLLGQAVPLLSFYDVTPANARILGPATWLRDAANQPNLAGALFAAPDPAARAGFEQQYSARFGLPAGAFTSLAYDAASIARVSAAPEGFQPGLLTRPDGFTGADGLLALQPGGQVRRGLAIFEVDRAGSHIVQPAPQTLATPGT